MSTNNSNTTASLNTQFFVCESAQMAVTLKYCLSHKSAASQGVAVRHPCRDCSPEQKLATINQFTLDELFHGKGFDEYKSAVGAQNPFAGNSAKCHA